MGYDDGDQNTAARRDIQDVRRHVRSVRSECYESLNSDGRVPHAQLRKALLMYWDALHEYDDDASEIWEENQLDAVPLLARERVPVSASKPGYGGHHDEKSKPKLAAMDAWTLIEYTQALDRVAKKLGFSAEPKTAVAGIEEAEV